MARKLFCEISPACYKISVEKEIFLRHCQNLMSPVRFACSRQIEPLPNLVKAHTSLLARQLHGVDMTLQYNKVTNIGLACQGINGLVIRPGEVFSFWRQVGRPTARRGFKEGLVITRKNGLIADVGGGLCQMANMVHWLVLNSPLTVVELHHHSDALFPDDRRRVPFGTGTSVCYNQLDYRFQNTSDQDVQLLTWIENGELCGELRSIAPFPHRYKLVEENHHFRKEGDDYYRVSQVYRLAIDRQSDQVVEKKLILDNHSRVLYDHDLIPKDEIKDGGSVNQNQTDR